MAPIRLLTNSMNKGDTKTAASTLSPSGMTIIDEISAYAWSGPDAFGTWLRDYDAWQQAEKLTDTVYKLGKPTRVVITGRRGYVALPVICALKQKGMAMRETGHMAFVLQEERGAWLITAFTWVAGTPKPVGNAG